LEPAWREALTTCLGFEKEHPDALKIFFAVPGDGLRALGKKTLQSLIGGTERQSEGLTPETLARIRKFTEDRDWDQFHTPANLAKSIAIEAAKLLECFQWSDTEYDLEHVKEELADVIVYCQDLLDKLDLNVNEIVNSKMSKNETKYPVEQAKGSAAKYTELKEAGK